MVKSIFIVILSLVVSALEIYGAPVDSATPTTSTTTNNDVPAPAVENNSPGISLGNVA